MALLNDKIKHFTPLEFKRLHQSQVLAVIDSGIPFMVSEMEQLVEGFEWCSSSNTLFDKDRKRIELTRLKSLISLLVLNKNTVVSYEAIRDIVWNGKSMSVYTMRNFIKKIRDKTCYEIIKNKSGHGYSILCEE